jgi:hypothetical protein
MDYKNAINLNVIENNCVQNEVDLSKYVCYKYENGKCYKYENGKCFEIGAIEKTNEELLQERKNEYCNAIQEIINNSKRYKRQYDELHGEGAYDRVYSLPNNNFDYDEYDEYDDFDYDDLENDDKVNEEYEENYLDCDN